MCCQLSSAAGPCSGQFTRQIHTMHVYAYPQVAASSRATLRWRRTGALSATRTHCTGELHPHVPRAPAGVLQLRRCACLGRCSCCFNASAPSLYCALRPSHLSNHIQTQTAGPSSATTLSARCRTWAASRTGGGPGSASAAASSTHSWRTGGLQRVLAHTELRLLPRTP